LRRAAPLGAALSVVRIFGVSCAMSYDFTLTDIIPAAPKAIYEAWLDSRGHSAMTGGKAMQSAQVGAAVSAWNGYISGTNLALTRDNRIVQSWRTTQFTGDHADSKITVTLTPVKTGTRVTLKHSNVPDGQTSYEKGGWQSHYFEPMKTYFGKKAKFAKTSKKKAKAKSAKRAKKKSKRTKGSR
jgi:activator of HSP90 ATPase